MLPTWVSLGLVLTAAPPLISAQEGLGGGGALFDDSPESCITQEQWHDVQEIVAAYHAAHPPSGAEGTPQKFPFYPMGGVLFEDVHITNYVDLKPGQGTEDWGCTPYVTYNGHDASDAALRTFGEQIAGVPIFAVLDGTVIDTHDGEPDMNIEALGQPANYVILDHGNGRVCYYWHMANGSVAVSPGEQVVAGQQIGLVGSSGNSTGPHLHFATYDGPQVVEPYAGPCNPGSSQWENQVPSDPTEPSPYLWEFAFSRTPIAPSFPPVEMPRTGQVQANDPLVYWWLILPNLPTGSTYRYRWKRPNGAVVLDTGTQPFGNGDFYKYSWWWFTTDIISTVGATGTWELRFWVNGVPQINAQLEVVSTYDPNFNRPPQPIGAVLEPAEPSSTDPLHCRVTTSVPYKDDLDYDIVRHRYLWTVDGVIARDVTTAARTDMLPAAPGGSWVQCEVTPTDGVDDGATVSASTWIQAVPYGCEWNPSGSLQVLSGAPLLGGSVTLALDNPFGTQGAGSIPLLVSSLAPDPAYPCGTLVPGLGMTTPSLPGELLIDLGPPSLPWLVGDPWNGPGQPVPIEIPIPDDASLAGISLFFQGLLYDPNVSAPIPLGLAEALEIELAD